MTTPLEEALSLDLQVLQALLQRNRCSHGRTLYFQRMSMAVRALERTLPFHRKINSLQHALEQYTKTRQEWTLDSADPIENVKKEFIIVKETLETGIPNLLSRIDYAAEALFVEVSRGFFLPLCIVALACLARIRILLKRQARDCVMELQSLLRDYTNVKEMQTWLPNANFFETILESFLEELPSDMQQARKPKFNVERSLQSLGLTRGKQQSDLMDVDNVEMDHKGSDNEIVEPQEETKLSAVPDGKLTRRDADDVGEHISHSTLSLASEIPLHKPSTHQRQDVSDKNSEFLPVAKSTSTSTGDRKRKKDTGASPSSSETRRNKKKGKKEAKKKKKKDVFDEIFGDV